VTGDRFIESTLQQEDPSFELPLRPRTLAEFIGQQAVCERLQVLVEAARQRGEALSHCLLCGPPGLGKTTLANILAHMMGSSLVITSGPVLERAGDLAGLLTNLQEGDLLFIDEIHRLSRTIEEYLYPAMEDFNLDLMLDSGPSARSVRVKLPPFALVGATTRVGLLSAPMRSRFGMTCRLDYYDSKALQQILHRSSRILRVELDARASLALAGRCRGTPRVANNLLRWVRDYAQIKAGGTIDVAVVEQALAMLQIDEMGLDEIDKRVLRVLIDHYEGGPVGLNTLAVAVGEESRTLEEVHEPYLILQGLLKRTPRGREVTALALQRYGKERGS
jgi:holliday junction DNA helicase RuvB